jgi:protein-S-isoprenylcysteine O-methyltransferase Ste14
MFAAWLLSVLWAAPALLLIQKLNAVFDWWRFADGSAWFAGMPLELYLGWVIAWGVVPQIALRRLPLWLSAFGMGMLDVALMPLFTPVVRLGSRWLIGEGVCLLIVLVPALGVARFTIENTHVRLRAWMQVAISGGVFLFLLPEIAFAARPGRGWLPLLEMPSWERQIALQLIGLIALPGIGAVMEFAERGGGTPIPFDPPVRLVTSGIYRYVANPMQVCCTLVLAAWAVLLKNGWLLLAPLTSFIYSVGIAEWDEGQDMAARFGEAWRRYRVSVRNWIPRWRPYHAGEPARLFMAASCGPCGELWRWIAARNPLGLEIVAAETLSYASIRRMRYVPEDGSSSTEGVRALARALEHLHLGWAIAGIALRLPMVWQFVQLVMDASGLGPRIPTSLDTCCAIESSER